MKQFIVYVATNLVNGNRYIGATSQGLLRRQQKHLNDASNKRRGCRVFNAALRKYGEAAFKWEILAELDSHEAMMAKEIALIKEMRPVYNITAGGQGFFGLERTPEWTAKISRALKGRRPSEATLAAARRARPKLYKSVVCLNDGRFFKSIKGAAEACGVGKRTISEVLAGRQFCAGGLSFAYSENPLTSEQCKALLAEIEQRRQCVIAKRGVHRRRPVICLFDGEHWPSGVSAARHYGISQMRVVQLCQQGGQTMKGLRFAYGAP